MRLPKNSGSSQTMHSVDHSISSIQLSYDYAVEQLMHTDIKGVGNAVIMLSK